MNSVSCITAGRRKNAVARIKISDGSGKIIINNKTIDEYFGGLERLKKTALKPFDFWNGVRDYDFYVNVKGGGISGQAGAISHSLARAILKLNEPSKAVLKKEGLLTRDPRMVERKKPGRPKARKRFQFSKR
ncbi:30S ribosomal protein S9 [Candidatus Endomicrobiellum agilis]|jgi:small subunit ribosomal protein S9|uniref:30S ribosomal protein S9 n=1 Tax=Candidatus Endomicrobiellum agilis TaxID=3238957 RepID=UPI0035755020|nr:30S ribosomal protein S9 [Endomicrobium sp.]